MAGFHERSLIPLSPFHPHSLRRRSLQAVCGISLMLCVLGSAFFRTQVLESERLALQADDNRFRVVPLPAPRGTIFDRNGQTIAETVAGYALSVEPGPPDTIRARLRPLVASLGLDSAAVEEVVRRSQRSPLEPVPVVENLSFAQVSHLEERGQHPPGVLLEARPVRRYPAGAAVSHLVGYVAEISDRELDDPQWTGYRAGQQIGKSGVERAFERQVGGRLGARYVEVNARGKLVRSASEQFTEPAEPGQDLRLTIDLDLQRYAHQVFPQGMRGAVVAMKPGSGEILALYSAPSYDPNLLVGGIDRRVWSRLNSDPARPLINRALRGVYPPGSTWKLATAMVGLERGLIQPRQVLPIACSGGMTYAGRYSRCWKREGHGPQDLIRAIANSCNVYFYQLGILVGLNNLAADGTRLGFARRTGVDLPGEVSGIFPTGRDWYVKRFGWRPAPSEVMNVAIGQGPNSQTPLRMAQFFSALASTDGQARAPHVLANSKAPVETDLRVSRSTLEAVWEGMARVIEAGGTAHAVELRRWKLYGKTGTAQNSEDAKRHHAWFTGFAGPRDGGPPEVVVAVIVEFGESGSGTAAPVAARIADFYLNRLHGHPTPPLARPETVRVGSVLEGAAAPSGRPVRDTAPGPRPEE